MSSYPLPGASASLATLLAGGLGGSSMGSLNSALLTVNSPPRWIYLVRRFKQLLDNITIPQWTLDDGAQKQASVIACMNREYWDHSSDTLNGAAVGSWGKQTQSRPSADIDLMFLLPFSVWQRFEQRSGNRQSQLLQEVRSVLGSTFSRTDLRGDGQVVIVEFDTIHVEVVPAFSCADGTVIICDTNSGGRYKAVAPDAEVAALNVADASYNGNARALARIAKRWRFYNSVSIKSFHLERLVIDFLATSLYSTNGLFWYDWIVRDFFLFLINRANTWIYMPWTGEAIYLGSDWLADAREAYGHACTACDHESFNRDEAAGAAWKEIFGAAVPGKVS